MFQQIEYLNLKWASIHTISQANRLFQNLKVNHLNINYLLIQVFDEKPQLIKNIPNIYFQKRLVLESERKLREVCKQFSPNFIDSEKDNSADNLDYFIRFDRWTEANID